MQSLRHQATAPDQGQKLSPLEWLLVVIIVFPAYGTFFPFSTYFAKRASALQSAGGDVARDATVVIALILLILVVLYAMDVKKSLHAILRNGPILVLVGWAMYSSTWAEIPSVSFNRSVRVFIFAMYAIYLVEFVEPPKARKIILYSFVISLSLSLLAIGALPWLAATTDGRGFLGTWRGAMGHKNSLGTLAALGFIYGAVSFYMRLHGQKICAYLVAISFVLLLLANSMTSVIGTLAVGGVAYYLIIVVPAMRDRILGLVMAVVLAVTAVLMVRALGSILELFGRDSTLTGRSAVWDFTKLMISYKPFWGYGHGVWTMPVFSEIVLEQLLWPSAHAHSLWLDLRLQLGLPGLIIGIAIWAITAMRILYLLLFRRMSDLVFPIGIFLFLSIRSYSETIILDPAIGDTFFFVFMYATFSRLVARTRIERRAASRPVLSRPVRRFGAHSQTGRGGA